MFNTIFGKILTIYVHIFKTDQVDGNVVRIICVQEEILFYS